MSLLFEEMTRRLDALELSIRGFCLRNGIGWPPTESQEEAEQWGELL